MSDPAGLPAALAPIAEVLALADSFALCVVTGPRDHRDTVYLRLAASLTDEFEVVRHRLDRDGLEFFDVLTGGDGVRPRVVFMSGLERMSDEARRDTTVRLNLIRDSWAPHPARVILWLPAWGLGEFRRLAPDLFHWRSCLVALHDADLPIRTEIEYLVWACERFGRANRVPLVTPVDVAEVWQWPNGRRTAHSGYSAQERSILLRSAMKTFATLRLQMGAVASRDLDVLSRRVEDGAPPTSPPLPLLFQAAAMAGRLVAEPGWLNAARATGIPLADEAPGFLDRLGERGSLIVLLDGFDLLDLSPGSPADRFLTWLQGVHPAIGIVEFTADALPGSAGGFYGARGERVVGDGYVFPRSFEAREAVVALLEDLFGPDDILGLANYLFGPELLRMTPSDDPPIREAEQLTEVLERQDLLDPSFFEQLKELRPTYASAIDAVARFYLGAPVL